MVSFQILLLEAGDEEPLITDIVSMPSVAESDIFYTYQTEPEPVACAQTSGRCLWSSGKVMGGSSSINAMWYARGVKQDYDGWEKLGNPGWSYEEVLPYFKKSEDLRNPEVISRIIEKKYCFI